MGKPFPCFDVSDIVDAVPVPKGFGGSGPPGWFLGVFQKKGPLAWLLDDTEVDGAKTKAGKGGTATTTAAAAAAAASSPSSPSSEESEGSKSSKSSGNATAWGLGQGGSGDSSGRGGVHGVHGVHGGHGGHGAAVSNYSLAPLPFGSGAGAGCGGHPSTVPCPLKEVDELLAMAQARIGSRQWGVVYDLASQVSEFYTYDAGVECVMTILVASLIFRNLLNCFGVFSTTHPLSSLFTV